MIVDEAKRLKPGDKIRFTNMVTPDEQTLDEIVEVIEPGYENIHGFDAIRYRRSDGGELVVSVYHCVLLSLATVFQPCVCPSFDLMIRGCTCGAFAREKGLVAHE